MRRRTVLNCVLVAAVAVMLAVAGVTGASASARRDGRRGGADHVVFVQTNDPSGNHVVAYRRADDGSLTVSNSYPTGGLGGVLGGAASDTLASQGSLVYDDRHRALIAVNAGSNTVTVFAVRGDQLTSKQVISSGGTFPVSVAVHRQLVYVLNARDGSSVSGYRWTGQRLQPLRHGIRPLGLDPNAGPEFLTSPAQVGFTPGGRQLLVTTKGNGHDVLAFSVRGSGTLADEPVVNSLPDGTAPFAFVFDDAGRLVLTLAGSSALATYTVTADGHLANIATAPNGQQAACWVVDVGGRFYVSNTGTSNLSIYDGDDQGGVTVRQPPVPTDPGTIDSAASNDGQFLYVQAGLTGTVDIFRIEADGALTSLGSTTVPDSVGFEGIVAA
jgi:6-phosphogluconolactonase (cycloisomerase 2 family)